MFGPKVEMPVSYCFRNYNKMPELEQKALELCEGKIRISNKTWGLGKNFR